MERRLSAIFAADMVGYSKLIEADEMGTLERQRTHRAEVIDPAFEGFHGRIVKEMGDGVLVEFPSVVEAVQCAVTIQRAIPVREADVPDGRRIHYRIGINLGDIVTEGNDIFGDGVNIAARLEQQADPGGICISGAAYDQLKFNLDVGYEALGELQVKNIQQPVRAYRVLTDPDLAGQLVEKQPAGRTKVGRMTVAAGIFVLSIAIGVSWWWSQQSDVVPADGSRIAYALPDKPSIAILPFGNLSDDEQQAYFADGFTEDLITNVAQSKELFVIARNSTFSYKGRSVTIGQVAEELGVRYVLEGSVRRIGENLRITAQLIDASNGTHVWAKRYDRPTESIFDIQDELSREIAGTLLVNIKIADLVKATQKRPSDLSAYEYVLRARAQYDVGGKESLLKARALAEKAIAIDADYAPAYAILGTTYNDTYITQVEGPIALDQAESAARKAIELDPRLSTGYQLLGRVLLRRWRHTDAVAALERAIALNPNQSELYASLADILTFANRPAEAVEMMLMANRLNPLFPSIFNMYLGRAYYFSENHDDALVELETCIVRAPKRRSCRIYLAAAYAALGRLIDAKQQVAKLQSISPNFSISSSVENHLPFAPEAMQFFVDDLRKAGVPE